MSRIIAVIPAHNEASTIAQTVCALSRMASLIVVVADSCVDDTAQRAREAGAVVVERRGRGDKARALAEGLRWIAGQAPDEEDVVVFVDADVGESAEEVVRLVAVARDCRDSMVVGVLPPAGRRGGMGLVLRLAQAIVYLRTGKHLRAPLSGQRALQWGVVRKLRRLARGFGVEVGLALDLIPQGVVVDEIEVSMHHRYWGRTWRGFWHRARQGWHVCLAGLGFRQVALWKHE